jgi:hypothetical protein
MHSIRIPALIFSCLAGLSAHAALITYDFEDLPLGRMQSLTDSKGGVVATLTTTDPSGLGVSQNSGTSFAPPFMGHFVSNGTGFPIDISFSSPLDSASLDFGTDNLAGISTLVTVKAYEGGPSGVLLFASSTLGSVTAGFSFPQGAINISAPGFDTLVVSGAQPGLAIDNLTVSTVPEPGSLGMLVVLSGFLGLVKRGRGSSRDSFTESR